MDSYLKISRLKKVFNEGDFNEVAALENINLELSLGQYVLLIGDNGSGKSTLLNLIDGRLEVTNGDIEINDKSILDVPTYRRSQFIYRLFQNSTLGTIPIGSVYENLAIALKRDSKMKLTKKLVASRDREYIKDIIKEYSPELVNRLDRKIFMLSPGERQAIILATLQLQLNLKPKILLADEPTSSLSPDMAVKCQQILLNFQDKGWLCLVVTHDERLIRKHTGRLIELKHGRVLRDEN